MYIIGGITVLKTIKEKLAGWILEIVLILFSVIGTFIWGIHCTNGEQQIQIEVSKNRISTLEEQIESFRRENREDHKEILSEIKKKI
jgi:hypothetical protein